MLYLGDPNCRREEKRSWRNRNCLHHRRYLGGQDSVSVCSSSQTLTPIPRSTSTSLNRNIQSGLPVGNRSIVPLLHIWLRLNQSNYSLRESRGSQRSQRTRLEQRSVLQNICQVPAAFRRILYQLFGFASSKVARTKRDARVAQQGEQQSCLLPAARFFTRILSLVSEESEIR